MNRELEKKKFKLQRNSYRVTHKKIIELQNKIVSIQMDRLTELDGSGLVDHLIIVACCSLDY